MKMLLSIVTRTPARWNAVRVVAIWLSLASGSLLARDPFSRIVVFGDSLSDTGNAYALTGGFFPSSPPNAAGRIGNGALWVEYLSADLRMGLHGGDNYAVAGARTDEDNFNALLGLTPLAGTGLQSQIDDYLASVGPGGIDCDALHVVWIGANDVFTFLTFGGDVNVTVFNAITNTAGAISDLAQHGARHFLVVNLPDLGLTPFGLSQGAVGSAQLSFLSDNYNGALEQALDALAAGGIKTARLDAADLIRDIAADPESFGLIDATTPALLAGVDPTDYLFWDGAHPTTSGHELVANRAIETLVGFYSPRKGEGHGPGLVNSLNGLVHAPANH